MTKRALLLDAGNTRIKWGLLANDRLRRTGSVTREKIGSSGLGALVGKLPRDVDTVLISNVAGNELGTRLAGAIGLHCGCDVNFAQVRKKAFGIENAYRRPRRLGIDRWVAMIGARSEFRGALCVVDAGTAVTIDALDGSGRHLGGQIVPGLRLMARSLATETSDIGAAARTAPDPANAIEYFAGTTRRAVQAGALNAVCGAVERSARLLRAEGLKPRIVLTGGDASRILKQLDGAVVYRPHLVLQGLAFMLQDKR